MFVSIFVHCIAAVCVGSNRFKSKEELEQSIGSIAI